MATSEVVHTSHAHTLQRGDVKMKKKKSPLYVGKEFYGKVPIEEAFKKALEPYFNKEKSFDKTGT